MKTDLCDRPEFSTGGVPDEVVNQRALISIYATATGPREGCVGAFVWLDRSDDPDIPFGPEADDGRGWGGEGLSADERRYIAAILYAQALAFATFEEGGDAPAS